MSTEMYEAALKYAGMGWVVHPVRPRGKAPIPTDWAKRTQLLTIDELRRAFEAGDNNIGVVCGPVSDLTVIDFDDMNFYGDIINDLDTSNWLTSTRAKEGEKATRGHFFFKYDSDFTQRMGRKFGEEGALLGIDILSGNRNRGGSNVVIAPSIHPSGNKYRFNREFISRGDIPAIPQELKKRLLRYIALEEELYKSILSSRGWVKEIIAREDKENVFHGGDGRRLMLALTAELKKNGLTDDGIHFLAKVIYRGTYDQSRTEQELRYVSPTPWTSDILCVEFPEHCSPDNTRGKAGKEQLRQENTSQAVQTMRAEMGRVIMGHWEMIEALQAKLPIYYDRTHNYWMWNEREGIYQIIDETDILRTITEILDIKSIYRSSVKSEILEMVKSTGRARKLERPGKDIIQFKDGCIDLKTGERFKPDPSKLYSSRIPHKIGNSEETPTIDRLFEAWVGEENKQLLYEICAYCLYDSYPIHRIFTLVGRGRNGKGQFQHLLTEFIGVENTTHTGLEALINNRFESGKLYNKKLATMGETNFNTLQNTSQLKMLSGGDMISGEFKRKDPFEFVNTAKIVISSNSLPVTMDRTDGFYRRWLIIDFNNKFPEGKDIFETVPEAEYENLALKCTRLLRELLERGSFTGEGTVEERMRKYEYRSNPVSEFIELECIKEERHYTPLWFLFDKYEEFCTKGGHRKISKKEFSKILENMGYEVQEQRKYSQFDQVKYKRSNINKDANWATVLGLDFEVGEVGEVGHFPLNPLYRELSESKPTSPTSPTNSHLLSNEVIIIAEYCNNWEKVYKKSINSQEYVNVAFEYCQGHKVNDIELVKSIIGKIRGIAP